MTGINLQYKQVGYTNIQTIMTDDTSAATEPLLTEETPDGLDPNIPPLNAEDPLFGLKEAQVNASREIFGRNEIIIPETPLWKLFLHQFVGFLVSFAALSQKHCHRMHGCGCIIYKGCS